MNSTMAEVENYVRTDFVTDFLKGTSDQAATDRLSARVAGYTGLDPALVRRLDGRVDISYVSARDSAQHRPDRQRL